MLFVDVMFLLNFVWLEWNGWLHVSQISFFHSILISTYILYATIQCFYFTSDAPEFGEKYTRIESRRRRGWFGGGGDGVGHRRRAADGAGRVEPQPAVDAALVEGVRALGQHAEHVPGGVLAQAHRAARRGGRLFGRRHRPVLLFLAVHHLGQRPERGVVEPGLDVLHAAHEDGGSGRAGLRRRRRPPARGRGRGAAGARAEQGGHGDHGQHADDGEGRLQLHHPATATATDGEARGRVRERANWLAGRRCSAPRCVRWECWG